VLVSLCWPHLAYASDAVWLLGLFVGAVAGVLAQVLIHWVLMASTRGRAGTRLLTRHH